MCLEQSRHIYVIAGREGLVSLLRPICSQHITARAVIPGELFMNYNIAQTEDFEKYLNKYDVIHLDMQWILMDAGAPERISGYINKNVISELADLYKDIDLRNQKTLYGALSVINSMTNNKFVIIIDEWDVLIRDEAANSSVQEEYINFLRGMFKGSEPTKYIELAFLTGILPIKS